MEKLLRAAGIVVGVALTVLLINKAAALTT